MTKTIQFDSKALGRTVDVTIIEPARLTADGRCSTLFALHGMTGKHSDWVDNARLDNYVANYPTVAILPSAEDSFYVDSSLGAYETMVAKELVAYADAHYPTLGTAPGRGILGLSMGGWGALLLALRHPETFGAAASLSGALDFNLSVGWDISDKIFGMGEAGKRSREGHDLASLAKKFVIPVEGSSKLKYTGPAIYFDCGEDDSLLYSNHAFAQRLREAHIPFEYHEYPGGHEWVYWDRHVQDSLAFLARELGW